MKVPELSELSKLSDLDALTIVSLVLENGDEKFDNWLTDYFEFFIDYVKQELIDKKLTGIKWDDVILRVEWKWTIKDRLENSEFNQTERAFIMQMTSIFPEGFDLKTLEGEEKTLSIIQEEFEDLIKRDQYFKQRYNRVRSARLKELFDSQLEKNITLHQGFNK